MGSLSNGVNEIRLMFIGRYDDMGCVKQGGRNLNMSDSSRLPMRKGLMPIEDLSLNNEIFQGTRRLMQLLKRLWPEEEGQGLSEYALLLFMVSLTAVTAMGGLASRINTICSIACTHVSATTSRGSLTGNSTGYAGTSIAGDNSYTKDQSPKPSM